MAFAGKDRRIHQVYITRNTEYHVRAGVCVAVRDRRSRAFRSAHIALDLRLEGGVRQNKGGGLVPNLAPPAVGDAIFFTRVDAGGDSKQIVTSRLERIDRPQKRDVMAYPPR